jgi:hypothetical protein
VKYTGAGSLLYGQALKVSGNSEVDKHSGFSEFIGVSMRKAPAASGEYLNVKSVGYAECLFSAGTIPVAGNAVYLDSATPGKFTHSGMGNVKVGIIVDVPAAFVGANGGIVGCLICGPVEVPVP